MSTVKIGRLQRRVLEIGLVSRIAHNLAKYRCMTSTTLTPEEFIVSVRDYMVGREIEFAQIDEWMAAANAQANSEVEFFIINGRFADSHGGSSIAVCALIGPILDELGY